ncbi:Pseudouridine synthase, RsuA/RluB/E/F [Syntrophomonas zehnderi OL-4]|uniref:Pseudouridine synthase n=1 Tax=Syntrophomonas zehnderi OL-4 TaxID=690567 RepID=A0A0E4GCC4_9FIRM|nr:pseudouridine synthase [Syntrophomonas zehnderi]CFX93761.1 Pseudouridine synthase, RsuA/RluB/E/F [Syntrophomonas zehnderi OL-4]
MRIAKYLAHSGVASRRRCEELIKAGQVKVNGTVITALGTQVNPDVDIIELRGEIITNSQLAVYYLLNKPPGYICSVYDPQGRSTVLDLIENCGGRIYPVGRLDYDTAGLIILTNDGEFANLMVHPRYKIKKTYEAWVKGRVREQELMPLTKGIMLEDGMTAPAEARLLRVKAQESLIKIVIHEGRKRQIKRMCAAIGHPVIRLKRTGFDFLSLDGLQEGQYRFLSSSEVKALKESAGEKACFGN